MSIRKAAGIMGIKASTAKYICRNFEKTGKILKKAMNDVDYESE